jgi:hypothetical protein
MHPGFVYIFLQMLCMANLIFVALVSLPREWYFFLNLARPSPVGLRLFLTDGFCGQIAMICICFVSLLVALFVRSMDHRRRRKRALEDAAVEREQPTDVKGGSGTIVKEGDVLPTFESNTILAKE